MRHKDGLEAWVCETTGHGFEFEERYDSGVPHGDAQVTSECSAYIQSEADKGFCINVRVRGYFDFGAAEGVCIKASIDGGYAEKWTFATNSGYTLDITITKLELYDRKVEGYRAGPFFFRALEIDEKLGKHQSEGVKKTQAEKLGRIIVTVQRGNLVPSDTPINRSSCKVKPFTPLKNSDGQLVISKENWEKGLHHMTKVTLIGGKCEVSCEADTFQPLLDDDYGKPYVFTFKYSSQEGLVMQGAPPHVPARKFDTTPKEELARVITTWTSPNLVVPRSRAPSTTAYSSRDSSATFSDTGSFRIGGTSQSPAFMDRVRQSTMPPPHPVTPSKSWKSGYAQNGFQSLSPGGSTQDQSPENYSAQISRSSSILIEAGPDSPNPSHGPSHGTLPATPPSCSPNEPLPVGSILTSTPSSVYRSRTRRPRAPTSVRKSIEGPLNLEAQRSSSFDLPIQRPVSKLPGTQIGPWMLNLPPLAYMHAQSAKPIALPVPKRTRNEVSPIHNSFPTPKRVEQSSGVSIGARRERHINEKQITELFEDKEAEDKDPGVLFAIQTGTTPPKSAFDHESLFVGSEDQ